MISFSDTRSCSSDNSTEFTHFFNTNGIHPSDMFCDKCRIHCKPICPKNPRHNNKVKQNHKNDQRYFLVESLSVAQKSQIKSLEYTSNGITTRPCIHLVGKARLHFSKRNLLPPNPEMKLQVSKEPSRFRYSTISLFIFPFGGHISLQHRILKYFGQRL